MKQTQGNSDIGIKIFVCIAAAAATLYAYIEKQNELTELRLEIPAVAKELRQINDENTRLKYELDQFESPIHLMELARKPEFSHLKYPLLKDVIIINNQDEKTVSDAEKSNP